jgi:hypothetical protein
LLDVKAEYGKCNNGQVSAKGFSPAYLLFAFPVRHKGVSCTALLRGRDSNYQLPLD